MDAFIIRSSSTTSKTKAKPSLPPPASPSSSPPKRRARSKGDEGKTKEGKGKGKKGTRRQSKKLKDDDGDDNDDKENISVEEPFSSPPSNSAVIELGDSPPPPSDSSPASIADNDGKGRRRSSRKRKSVNSANNEINDDVKLIDVIQISDSPTISLPPPPLKSADDPTKKISQSDFLKLFQRKPNSSNIPSTSPPSSSPPDPSPSPPDCSSLSSLPPSVPPSKKNIFFMTPEERRAHQADENMKKFIIEIENDQKERQKLIELMGKATHPFLQPKQIKVGGGGSGSESFQNKWVEGIKLTDFPPSYATHVGRADIKEKNGGIGGSIAVVKIKKAEGSKGGQGHATPKPRIPKPFPVNLSLADLEFVTNDKKIITIDTDNQCPLCISSSLPTSSPLPSSLASSLSSFLSSPSLPLWFSLLFPSIPSSDCIRMLTRLLLRRFHAEIKDPSLPSSIAVTASKAGIDALLLSSPNDWLWTDKYAPLSFNEILTPPSSISMKRIRDFVRSWAPSTASSDRSLPPPPPPSTNTLLIGGPLGCGKSALIEALSSTLSLSVLEINSSERRSGRDLLSRCGEATRSHRLALPTSSALANNQSASTGEISSFFSKASNRFPNASIKDKQNNRKGGKEKKKKKSSEKKKNRKKKGKKGRRHYSDESDESSSDFSFDESDEDILYELLKGGKIPSNLLESESSDEDTEKNEKGGSGRKRGRSTSKEKKSKKKKTKNNKKIIPSEDDQQSDEDMQITHDDDDDFVETKKKLPIDSGRPKRNRNPPPAPPTSSSKMKQPKLFDKSNDQASASKPTRTTRASLSNDDNKKDGKVMKQRTLFGSTPSKQVASPIKSAPSSEKAASIIEPDSSTSSASSSSAPPPSPIKARKKVRLLSSINAVDGTSDALNDSSTSASQSLIMFEEIDEIFEEAGDTGFIRGIRQLMSQSKRPLILTCNHIPEEYLELPLQIISLSPPSFDSALLFLFCVLIVEQGFDLALSHYNALKRLLDHTQNDIRRCLLNIQLYSHSIPLTKILSPPSSPDSLSCVFQLSQAKFILEMHGLAEKEHLFIQLFTQSNHDGNKEEKRNDIQELVMQSWAVSEAYQSEYEILHLNYLQSIDTLIHNTLASFSTSIDTLPLRSISPPPRALSSSKSLPPVDNSVIDRLRKEIALGAEPLPPSSQSPSKAPSVITIDSPTDNQTIPLSESVVSDPMEVDRSPSPVVTSLAMTAMEITNPKAEGEEKENESESDDESSEDDDDDDELDSTDSSADEENDQQNKGADGMESSDNHSESSSSSEGEEDGSSSGEDGAFDESIDVEKIAREQRLEDYRKKVELLNDYEERLLDDAERERRRRQHPLAPLPPSAAAVINLMENIAELSEVLSAANVWSQAQINAEIGSPPRHQLHIPSSAPLMNPSIYSKQNDGLALSDDFGDEYDLLTLALNDSYHFAAAVTVLATKEAHSRITPSLNAASTKAEKSNSEKKAFTLESEALIEEPNPLPVPPQFVLRNIPPTVAALSTNQPSPEGPTFPDGDPSSKPSATTAVSVTEPAPSPSPPPLASSTSSSTPHSDWEGLPINPSMKPVPLVHDTDHWPRSPFIGSFQRRGCHCMRMNDHPSFAPCDTDIWYMIWINNSAPLHLLSSDAWIVDRIPLIRTMFHLEYSQMYAAQFELLARSGRLQYSIQSFLPEPHNPRWAALSGDERRGRRMTRARPSSSTSTSNLSLRCSPLSTHIGNGYGVIVRILSNLSADAESLNRWLSSSGFRFSFDGSYVGYVLSSLKDHPYLIKLAHRIYFHLSHCVAFSHYHQQTQQFFDETYQRLNPNNVAAAIPVS